jgi:hypothetical protein
MGEGEGSLCHFWSFDVGGTSKEGEGETKIANIGTEVVLHPFFFIW